MNLQRLEEVILKNNYSNYRFKQAKKQVFQRLVSAWSEASDLPEELRELLGDKVKISDLLFVEQKESVVKDTIKALFKTGDNYFVETVLMKHDRNRRTVCVSSQVGCRSKCSFCASGKHGLRRNLTTAEIVEQVIHINHALLEKGEQVTHIVYMGMGEPLDNYDAVVKSIKILTSKEMLNISLRRITVSTVGIIEGIRRLMDEDLKVNLVLSLHAPNQRIRQRLIPYARKNPLEEVLLALEFYSKKTKRDITFEYTLFKGINDGEHHAKELVALLKRKQCSVNLIPYNPVDGVKFERPERKVIQNFRKVLFEGSVHNTWRYTKGKDIAAACGQLALRSEMKKNLS